ncbi:MAG: class I SAM-dependent methyltransferase, partial [Bacteroidia bacterium]
PGSSVLDIGCGTGLYLKDLTGKGYELSGIDMSGEMIEVASKELPDVKFYTGDFMTCTFPGKFDLIYSVSVLEYIARNDLDAHFARLAGCLNAGGIIFIHYPHALCRLDTLYPDLNYIKYSPTVIEKTAKRHFDILTHQHCFDDRVITDYDRKPYPSARGTFKNGYLLIARKCKA